MLSVKVAIQVKTDRLAVAYPGLVVPKARGAYPTENRPCRESSESV